MKCIEAFPCRRDAGAARANGEQCCALKPCGSAKDKQEEQMIKESMNWWNKNKEGTTVDYIIGTINQKAGVN